MVLKGDREFQMRKVCRSGQVVSLPAEERRKSVATASGLLPQTGRANPLLSKEGQARSAGVVCSKTRSHLIDIREALLINRYCSPLNRPPQPSLREGIPALLRRGMVRSTPVRSSMFQFTFIDRAYGRPENPASLSSAMSRERCVRRMVGPTLARSVM